MTARPAEVATAASSPTRRAAPLGPVIAISVAFALGALLVIAPLVWVVLPTTPLPEPFPDHHQDAETLIFLVAFALLVPFGVLTAPRIADRIATGPSSGALSTVAGLLSGGLALVVVATRLSVELPWGGGPGVLATAAGLWWIVAIAMLRRAASDREWGRVTSGARAPAWSWAIAGLLLVPVALAFTAVGSISVPVLLLGAALVAAVLLLRERVRLPALSGWLGAVVDLGLVALLLLGVPNLVIFTTGDPATAFDTAIIQFHQNFFLGPANQILHGDAMLVDVLSQYGVGSIYFLAGAFMVIPMGNGTLGLVEGVLSALVFVGTFATLRIAGVSRLLAGSAMAVGVIVVVYGLQYPLGGLLQHGAFRFGLPVGVLVGAVAESCWPRIATPARALQLLTVAVASIWALETFAYTMLTVVAVAAIWVVTLPRGHRRREAVRWGVQIAAACIVAHLVLAGATLATTGELPDWGWYLNTLREFLFGTIGDLTYDFTSFS
ncbi:MAG: hypothetical protein ACRD0V_14410, partial [Acidimicrobiales bacterium]